MGRKAPSLCAITTRYRLVRASLTERAQSHHVHYDRFTNGGLTQDVFSLAHTLYSAVWGGKFRVDTEGYSDFNKVIGTCLINI